MQQKSPKILKQNDNATIKHFFDFFIHKFPSSSEMGKKKIIRVGAHVRPRGVQVELDGENIHQCLPGGSQRISQQLCFFLQETCRPARRVFQFYKMISKLRHWFPIRYKLLSWGLIRHNRTDIRKDGMMQNQKKDFASQK